MDYIKDFIYVNKHSITKTISSISKNWMIVFTGLVYSLISMVVFGFVGMLFRGPLSIISGFITYFIQSAIISNYLYLLFNIINYDRFNLNDFKKGFMYFIWKVYGVFFILYLGQLLLSLTSRMLGSSAYLLNIAVGILLFILLNPLPETIYIKNYSPSETILYCLDFIKENWLNWLLPNILLTGLIYIVTGNLLTGLVNTGIGLGFGFSSISIIKYLVGQLIFSFMMVYRGHLFKQLSTSTRRKRMFMNKF